MQFTSNSVSLKIMRGKAGSPDLVESVYRFKDENPDYCERSIARFFNIKQPTTHRILKQRIPGTYTRRTFKRGRPRKTTVQQDRRLRSKLRRNPLDVARKILRRARLTISRRTVARRIKEFGYSRHVVIQDTLTITQKRVRVRWIRNHRLMDLTQVIWSDETVFFPAKRPEIWENLRL